MARKRPLHERIKEHVVSSKLTAADIVEKTGWSEQKTVRKLNGKTRWLAEDMEILSQLLGKSVADLYRDKARGRAA